MDNFASSGDGAASRSSGDALPSGNFQDYILPAPPPPADTNRPGTDRAPVRPDTNSDRRGDNTSPTGRTADATDRRETPGAENAPSGASDDPLAKYNDRYKPASTTNGAGGGSDAPNRSNRLPGPGGPQSDRDPAHPDNPRPGPDNPRPGPDNPRPGPEIDPYNPSPNPNPDPQPDDPDNPLPKPKPRPRPQPFCPRPG